MSSLVIGDVQGLVVKAFVLEALTNKPGCTTRYEDLPGKPLQDFVIAGINSADVFGKFAGTFEKNSDIYSYNVAALKASNKHKSPKYINFGLLEIMFPAVAARLMTNSPDLIIDTIINLIKRPNNNDVGSLLATRELAWSTSETPHKINFKPNKYKDLGTVWDFYMAINSDFTSDNSNFQWTEQFRLGLPILRAIFNEYTKEGEVMQTTESIFSIQKESNHKVAIGIIADMCAAAIFLWLSFNDRPA